MKKQAYTLIGLVVLMGSLAVAAQAQGSGQIKLSADVPFAFNAGDKLMPAGKYVITVVNPSSDTAVLHLRSNNSAGVMLQANEVIGTAGDTAKLVFNRYGNRFFFAQVWIDGESSGLRAMKSKSERSAEKELAGLKPGTETVAIRTH